MVRTLAAMTLVLAFPVLGVAQKAQKPVVKRGVAKRISASDGPQMFQSYCAPCHGKAGKGDGPAAPALKNKPADLTQLAKTHGGTYSTKDFEDKVNGLAMSPSHGTSEMPVWGPVFRELGNDQLRVYNLKKYIDTLQAQ